MKRDVAGVKVTEATACALSLCPASDAAWDSYKAVHLFPDGNSGTRDAGEDVELRPAWAIAMVGEQWDGAFRFAGVIGAPTEESVSADLGVCVASAQAAELAHASELVAMLWSLCFAMQLPAGPNCTISPDNLNALRAAGCALQANADVHLARLCAQLGCHLANAGRGSLLQHQYGHCDHPWNDLADSYTEHISKGSPHPALPPIVGLLCRSLDYDWGWLEELPPQLRSQYPEVDEGEFSFSFDKSVASECFIHCPTAADNGPEREVSFETCTYVTCNFCTLDVKDFLEGKAKATQAQFDEARVLAVLGQEARRKAGQHSTKLYHTAYSDAQKGTLGVLCMAVQSRAVRHPRRGTAGHRSQGHCCGPQRPAAAGSQRSQLVLPADLFLPSCAAAQDPPPRGTR